VQIPGRELKLIVDLAAESGVGGWQGSITIPGLGLKGAPLDDIALKGSDIVFSMKTALADQRTGPAKFKARFVGDGKLAGDFVQAGNVAPFALEKTGPPQVEIPPRSTAIAKEIEGEWKGGYELLRYPRKVRTAGPKEPPRSLSSWGVRKINCRSIASCSKENSSRSIRTRRG